MLVDNAFVVVVVDPVAEPDAVAFEPDDFVAVPDDCTLDPPRILTQNEEKKTNKKQKEHRTGVRRPI